MLRLIFIESVGDRVRLWDVKKAEYNNKEGTIKGKYNRRKKRWPVELDFNGKTVNVEAKNLRKVKTKLRLQFLLQILFCLFPLEFSEISASSVFF